MPGGGNSESSGYTSISGVSGPGQANGVVASDAVSRDGGALAEGGNCGPGCSVPGGSVSPVPTVGEEKKKLSKSFWKKMLGKS